MNTIEINPFSELVYARMVLEINTANPNAYGKRPSNDQSRDFRLVPLVIYDKHPEIHDVRKGRSGN